MSIPKTDNTKTHIGDEIDFAWTHLFMDGKLSFQAVYGHIFAAIILRKTWGPTPIKIGPMPSSG